MAVADLDLRQSNCCLLSAMALPGVRDGSLSLGWASGSFDTILVGEWRLRIPPCESACLEVKACSYSFVLTLFLCCVALLVFLQNVWDYRLKSGPFVEEYPLYDELVEFGLTNISGRHGSF